jgi:hypothetical protein
MEKDWDKGVTEVVTGQSTVEQLAANTKQSLEEIKRWVDEYKKAGEAAVRKISPTGTK